MACNKKILIRYRMLGDALLEIYFILIYLPSETSSDSILFNK